MRSRRDASCARSIGSVLGPGFVPFCEKLTAAQFGAINPARGLIAIALRPRPFCLYPRLIRISVGYFNTPDCVEKSTMNGLPTIFEALDDITLDARSIETVPFNSVEIPSKNFPLICYFSNATS